MKTILTALYNRLLAARLDQLYFPVRHAVNIYHGVRDASVSVRDDSNCEVLHPDDFMNGFIELVTGTLGGGKTSFAVERAFEHLCRGGWVFTNIEMYPDKIAERMAEKGLKFDPARLVILRGNAREFHKQVCRGTANSLVMLVVDEAGLELNSRDYRDTDKETLAFNTMARKLDIWLVYISQDATDVDKQLRRKADTIWVCRNMKKLRIWGFIPFPIPLYFRVRFDNTRGTKPQKLDSELILKSPSWGLYNSDALVGQVSEGLQNMRTVEASPLERIPKRVTQRKSDGVPWWVWLGGFSSCASSFYFSSF